METIKVGKDTGECQTNKCEYKGNLYTVNKLKVCYKCFMELDLLNERLRK